MNHDRDGVHGLTRTHRTEMRRRDFLAVAATTVTAIGAASWAVAEPGGEMYGLIGKITAVPGKRDELIAILLEGVGDMPGCLSYIVAKDASDADAIWISEAWESEARHAASLSLPSVKDSIAKGRPLIAGFSNRVVTMPVGGHGLIPPKYR
jgi:quinol monooxygenase YgiN